MADRQPAIFFDCDGVLNEEPGDPGIVRPDQVKAIAGAGSALRRAREAGFLTVAITNRPQVAKGLVSFAGLDRILGRLEAVLAEEGGALDRIYSCPHYPEAGFPGEVAALKVRCECRKPGTLLLRQALAELPIDCARSVLIGDSLRDIGAGRGIGIWAYGVRTGYGCRDQARYRREAGIPPVPDLMFECVSEAVDFAIGLRALAAPVLTQIRAALALGKKPVLIGISGRSCAGKSVLAHAVVRCLGEDGVGALRVRLDDWIVPLADRAERIGAQERHRVAALPTLLEALRAGTSIQAPCYDAATREAGEGVRYDPQGQAVIVLEGGFAGHPTIRAMLDLAVFVTLPQELQRERFAAFYRWKGFDPAAVDALWSERANDEWPAVDAQREGADLVLTSAAGA